MKVLSVVGARPQFIKAAPVSRVLHSAGHREVLVHTGQHYDDEMSSIFFRELGIPSPAYNLGVGSASHGAQTGRMLEHIEPVMAAERPDWVLVYGDTNSTLAGALASVKLGLPTAHIEAGLRSFNRRMPEEHNRVLTDHCVDCLLCPTRTAVANLQREGLREGIHFVGDTMYDAVLAFAEIVTCRSGILEDLSISNRQYAIATLHRPYNTDEPGNLYSIVDALGSLGCLVIFAVHPRTKLRLKEPHFAPLVNRKNLRLIDPIGYLDMLVLLQNAQMVLTDSGGLQKEAYFLGTPCVTLRPETEWLETLEDGWNVVAGSDRDSIVAAALRLRPVNPRRREAFGDGHAAERIIEVISR